MKRLFYISAIALAAATAFASCEKTPAIEPVSVYLTTGTTPANEVNFTISVDALSGSVQTVGISNVSFKLCSLEPAKADITAQLKVDESKVSAPSVLLPSAAYEITASSASILTGETESATAFALTIKPEGVTEAGSYLLPLTVTVSEDSHATISETAGYINVKVVRNVVNDGAIPAGWKRLDNSAFTAGYLADYAGLEYGGFGIAEAFDSDLTTDWYSIYSADDYSYYYGQFAEIRFNEPVALAGLVAAMNPDSAYQGARARRVSVLFKYEGESDYDWYDKDFYDGYVVDENGNYVVDESGNYVIEYNVGDNGNYILTESGLVSDVNGGTSANFISEITGYQASKADYVIKDPNYENVAIDFSAQTGGKKVSSMILQIARINAFQAGWNDATADFVYAYYYDIWSGSVISEMYLFTK